MKKIFCLLLLSCFALTGCSSEISPEEADDIAADLRAYEGNINRISELKVKSKSTLHNKGTSNRQLIDNKHNETLTYELSTRFNYIHYFSSTSETDKVEEISNLSETEQWIYMKKKTLIKATRTKTKGSENKTYTKVENYSSAYKVFSTLFDAYLLKAYEQARGTSFLDTSVFSKYLERYENNLVYAAKFYSSGSGNFRIVGGAKLDSSDENSNNAKGVGTLSCSWNNYLLKSANLAFTLSLGDGTNKNDLKTDVAVSENVSKFIIPTYPNLSSFSESSMSSIF